MQPEERHHPVEQHRPERARERGEDQPAAVRTRSACGRRRDCERRRGPCRGACRRRRGRGGADEDDPGAPPGPAAGARVRRGGTRSGRGGPRRLARPLGVLGSGRPCWRSGGRSSSSCSLCRAREKSARWAAAWVRFSIAVSAAGDDDGGREPGEGDGAVAERGGPGDASPSRPAIAAKARRSSRRARSGPSRARAVTVGACAHARTQFARRPRRGRRLR